MPKKRVLILSVPVLVVLGWAVSVFLSIRHVGDVLPKPRQLHSITAGTGAGNAQVALASAPVVLGPGLDDPVQARDVTVAIPAEIPETELAAYLRAEEFSVVDPPLSVEERCVLMRDVDHWLVYGPGRPGSRAVERYWHMQEAELKVRADIEDDGFAHYFFAQTQLQAYIAEITGDDRDLDDISESRRGELVETIREYFSNAIRKGIKGRGPFSLAWLSYGLGDRTEAAAWLTLDERMGGDGFGEFRLNALRSPTGSFILDAYDLSEGAIRAEELIAEYDLAAGLLPTNECAQ